MSIANRYTIESIGCSLRCSRPVPLHPLVEWYEGCTTPLPWPAFYGATRPVPFSPMPHAHGLHTWFAIPPSLLHDFALVWLFLRFSHDLTCQRLALLLLCLSSMLLMLSISFAALLTCQCQFPFLAHAVCVTGPHVHDSLPFPITIHFLTLLPLVPVLAFSTPDLHRTSFGASYVLFSCVPIRMYSSPFLALA